jgi:ketosteroid isomerase-like protein
MHCSRYILFFVGWILCAWPVFIGAQQTAQSDAVRALELRWAEAYKLRKLDVLSSLLDDDCVSTFEDGSTLSKLGLISYIARPSERVEMAEVSDLKIRMHGQTAVVTGAYHERGESAGKPYDYRDRFTDVWIKVRGEWKLIASHYSIPAR